MDPSTEKYYPRELVDFAPDGAYAPYNWELFFHAPLLFANALSRNQRFEEARDWYHFIFNPIGVESAAQGGSAMSKYWITKPFYETTDPQYVQQRIENILRMLAGDTTAPGYSAEAKQAIEDQVLDWRTHPFDPHRIAGYRTVAYQKTVVMKYLDNLIAWGDNLFRQDSMESINEATQLYVLAAELLGPRPKKMPPQAKPPLQTFNELETTLDSFSNALVQVENLVPTQTGGGVGGSDQAPLPMLYFCAVPQNGWPRVKRADRLAISREPLRAAVVVNCASTCFRTPTRARRPRRKDGAELVHPSAPNRPVKRTASIHIAAQAAHERAEARESCPPARVRGRDGCQQRRRGHCQLERSAAAHAREGACLPRVAVTPKKTAETYGWILLPGC